MSGRVHEVSHLHKTRPNYLHIRAFRIYSEQTRSRQIFAVAPHCRTKIQGAGLDPHPGGGDW